MPLKLPDKPAEPLLVESPQGIRRFSDEAIQRQIDATTKLLDTAVPGTIVASVDYEHRGQLQGAIIAKTRDGQWTVMAGGYVTFGDTRDVGGRLGVRWTPPW